MKVKNKIITSLLLVLGLVLPNLCLAQGIIASAFLSAFAVLFGLIANILGTITGALLGGMVALFNWVISDSFISLSYTGLDNPFIEIGWTLTRDLTNIFFVLALVVIGLGTALRLTGYRAQRALPTLIIIALLINFTPVILGLIVDAANIVMNFFIQGGFASSKTFADYAVSQWDNMSIIFDVGGTFDPIDKAGAAVGSMVLVFFNLFAALIYGLFSIVFILRYIAIWILTILSPFAFACYIFPATRKVFSQWWNQFLQWSLLGVIAAFFLYLGDHFISMALSKDFILGEMAEIPDAHGLAPLMNQTLPYVIAIVFLSIGLMAALTFSPKGASTIIAAGQRVSQRAGKWAGKAAWMKTRSWARERQPEWARKTGEKMAKTATPKPGWGAEQRTIGGWFKRRAADVVSGITAPPVAAYRGLGRVVGPMPIDARTKAITKAEEEAEKIGSTNLLLSKVRGELAPGGSIDRAMGLAYGGIKKGGALKKALQDNLTEAEKTKLGFRANKLGVSEISEKLGRAFIEQVDKMGFKPLDAKDKAKGYTNITEKLIGEATKDEIKDLAKDVWDVKKNPKFMEAAQKFWSGPQLGRAADEFGRKFVEDYMATAEGRKNPTSWFLKNNQAALRYLSGAAAQDLGFRSIKGLSFDDVRQLTERWRKSKT